MKPLSNTAAEVEKQTVYKEIIREAPQLVY